MHRWTAAKLRLRVRDTETAWLVATLAVIVGTTLLLIVYVWELPALLFPPPLAFAFDRRPDDLLQDNEQLHRI